MSIRQAQKNKTRRAIMDSALGQLEQNKSFSNLSLREVTREAGIAANSFYRHFDNMNDLGLALVEEAGLSLRQILRKARERISKDGSAIDTSIDTFMEFLMSYPNHFRLLLKEQVGNSAEFREAIHTEFNHFKDELNDYMAERETENGRKPFETELISEAMVTLTFAMGSRALDSNKAQQKSYAERTKQQLRLLLLGAIASQQRI